MTELELLELELLEDTIKYYSENTERRCTDNRGCFYSPITIGKENISEGCAIGRHLDKDFALKIDEEKEEYNISSVLDKFVLGNEDKFPDWMLKMKPLFLGKLQNLHDDDDFWDENGLTEKGLEDVEEIKNHLAKNLY